MLLCNVSNSLIDWMVVVIELYIANLPFVLIFYCTGQEYPLTALCHHHPPNMLFGGMGVIDITHAMYVYMFFCICLCLSLCVCVCDLINYYYYIVLKN